MGINEIIVGSRVVMEVGALKEVVNVKGFTDDGKVIVRDTKGELIDVAPENIVKSFGL